jgi:hypothetical protein
VTVLGTIANLLPLPGAALTRLVVLRRGGATAGDSARALLAVSGVWLGVAFLFAGVGLGASRAWLGLVAVAVGVAALTVGGVMLTRLGAARNTILAVVGLEALLTVVGIARLWLALRAIDVDASILDTTSLAVSAPAAAAVGFIPGGLGVREGVAAGLGALSDLGAAEAGVATTIDRAVGMIVLVPVYALTARFGREPER